MDTSTSWTVGDGRRSPVLRSAYGTPSVEAFLIIAIATILLTRAYLAAMNYPQVGGKSLHIAHALWGGALMMTALVLGWLFIGFGVRVLCIVLGGIGFGLFLDEVGKFVTKNNDYFYGPSAEIMYVTVVLVLVVGRLVRDSKRPTGRESLANAAMIAADGIAKGLPESRREWAHALLDRARSEGADPETVEGIEAMLTRATPSRSRLRAAQMRAPRLVPRFLRSPRWVPVVGWAMVLTSFLGVVTGVVQLLGGLSLSETDLEVTVDRMTLSGGILWVTACITFGLAFPAMLRRNRTESLWPLRWLRTAALVYALLGALVDFAEVGFAALINLAIGLAVLAVISYHLRVRTAAGSASTRSAAVRL